MQPEDVSTLIEKGIALFELGKYEESLIYFDKAISVQPGDLSALYNKGFALRNLGRYEKAISYFDKAIEINPNLAIVREKRV
jgi:tetratricopeptide (TPR) repeat protein